MKFAESKGYYDEKSWKNLRVLSHGPSDRENNLRTILESFGISQPKESKETRGSSSPHGTEEAVHQLCSKMEKWRGAKIYWLQ